MPTISVIVPVYRAEAFLRKCTDSILQQTYTDLELLLIEDGSPDESGALCDAIAAEDDRVRVFHKENGGVSSARNLGLEHATGTYIAFVDSDDWLEPNALELLLRALETGRADAAGCGHYNVTADGQRTPESPALPGGSYGPLHLRSLLSFSLYCLWFHSGQFPAVIRIFQPDRLKEVRSVPAVKYLIRSGHPLLSLFCISVPEIESKPRQTDGTAGLPSFMQALWFDMPLFKVKNPLHVSSGGIGNPHAIEKRLMITVCVPGSLKHGIKEIFVFL